MTYRPSQNAVGPDKGRLIGPDRDSEPEESGLTGDDREKDPELLAGVSPLPHAVQKRRSDEFAFPQAGQRSSGWSALPQCPQKVAASALSRPHVGQFMVTPPRLSLMPVRPGPTSHVHCG